MTRTAGLSIAVSFAVFLLAWKAIVVIGGYPPFILPPPESVTDGFLALALPECTRNAEILNVCDHAQLA